MIGSQLGCGGFFFRLRIFLERCIARSKHFLVVCSCLAASRRISYVVIRVQKQDFESKCRRCGDGYEECGAELQKNEKGRRCGKKVEEDGGWVKKAGRSKVCGTGEDG